MYYRTVLKIPVAIGMSVLLGAMVTISSPLPRPVSAQDLPTPFLITPYFGKENISQIYHAGHRAIDFGSMGWERVLVAADGTVGLVDWWNDNCHQDPELEAWGFGLYIRIDHADGYQTFYAHLSATAFDLTPTDSDLPPQVNRGQVIATSGHTGWSTGAHLHFETRLNGTAIDPSNPSLWVDGWLDPNFYPSQNPNRPIPIPVDGATITVDDLDSGFTKGCNIANNWQAAIAGYNNHMWWAPTNNQVENCWAKWTPSIPQQGIYEVYVYIPNVNATSWQAPYTISHADGQSTGRIDQLGLNNQWVSIGVYRFNQGTANYVRIKDATGEDRNFHCWIIGQERCQLGADAVKFVRRAPTYLPDIRINSGYFNPSIVIRNNGGSAFVDVKFYDQSGAWVATNSTPNLAGNSIWEVLLPPLPNLGSVVIDASQDIAVTVANIREISPYSAGSYTGLRQTSSTLYLPLLHRNNSGWYSDFTILNAGNTYYTNLTVTFTPVGTGASCVWNYYNIPPNGSLIVDLFTNPPGCMSSPFVGGAKVVSSNGQPLAAVSTQRKDYTLDSHIDSFMVYEGSPAAFDPLPYPLLMRNNYNWNTSLILQNSAGTGNTVTMNYHHHSGAYSGGLCHVGSHSLGANGVEAVYPAPPDMSGCVPTTGALFVGASLADGAQPLAGIVNEIVSVTGNYNAMSYTSPGGGTKTVVAPLVMKNRDGWRGRNNWYTGLAVQNLGTATATVTVRYYYADGSYAMSETKTVPARSTGIFYPAPASGAFPSFIGSAWITADQPIAVVANQVSTSGTSESESTLLPEPAATDDSSMTNSGVNINDAYVP